MLCTRSRLDREPTIQKPNFCPRATASRIYHTDEFIIDNVLSDFPVDLLLSELLMIASVAVEALPTDLRMSNFLAIFPQLWSSIKIARVLVLVE